MNDFFDNQRILDMIWKRKFHFILVGIISILLSAVFSGPTFITPKFKSTARIYPTNIWIHSNESETEQMLEIVNSRDIKLKMIDAFQLDKVYGINRNDPHYLTYMLDLYDTNVKTSKTEFETVEIKVFDVNPQRASDMCDSIIHFYNKKVQEFQKILNWEMVVISKDALRDKNQQIDSISTILDTLKNDYGILDFNTQTPELTRGYMNALATGRGSAGDTKKIEELYHNFAKEGTKAIRLQSQLNYLIETADSIAAQRDFYFGEYNKEIVYCQVVENPVPADKKSYPIRWLIVALSTLSVEFLALLIFLVLEYRKKG